MDDKPGKKMMTNPTSFPKTTMMACQGKELGDIDSMLEVCQVELPSTPEELLMDPNLPPNLRASSIIIECHAVALACGDVRVMSGLTRELQGPAQFPYIPGGDCAGIVFWIPDELQKSGKCPFKIGDRVAVRFNPERVRGALAEYAIVDYSVCDVLPDNLSFVEGAVLAGAAPAMLFAERIKPNDRVLLLGGGGGVGSHAHQIMCKKQGTSFLAGVSSTPDRLLKPPYKYDKAIDYTQEDPFDMKLYGNDGDQQFDVVVDLAGVGSWLRLNEDCRKGIKSVVKPASQGGRYLTMVPDSPHFEIHSMNEAFKPFVLIPLFRALKSRLWGRWKLPAYTFAMSLPNERSHLSRTLDMAQRGDLTAIVDPKGPFPFTTEGIKAAYHLQESRHVQGKVVIEVQSSARK